MNPRILNFVILSAAVVFVLAIGGATQDQTYKVGSDSKQAPQAPSQPQNAEKSLGWGSNIQNARLAHAAEEAIRDRNFAAATEYAQRAAQSAAERSALVVSVGLCGAAGRQNAALG